MRALRLLVAGLIAIVAMAGVLLAAIVVFFTGLAAYVVQLFRQGPGPSQPGLRPGRPPAMRTDDAIDVVTTKVPDDPAER